MRLVNPNPRCAASQYGEARRDPAQRALEYVCRGLTRGRAGARGWRLEHRRQVDAQEPWALLESVPDGAVVVCAEGTVLYANEEACRLFRRPRATFIGVALEELVPARHRSQHAAHRARFFAAPRARAMGEIAHMCGLRADGTEFPVDIRIGPFSSLGGLAAIAIVRDLTARNEAEAERRRLADEVVRAQREWAATVDAMPAAVLVVADDGTVLRANRAAQDAEHCGAHDACGAHVADLLPLEGWAPPPQGRGWPDLREALNARTDALEWDARHDRSGRWFRMAARALPAQSGRATRTFLLAAKDVTERWRAREFIQTILDSMAQSVAVLDADGVIRHVNAGWRAFAVENGGDAEATGVGASYLLACRRACDWGDESAAPILAGLRDVLAGRLPAYHQEYPCHEPGGRQRWFLLQATPLRGAGAVVAHVDVTERKALADRLAHSERQDSIGKLAGGIAHDLNNILVAIFAAADLLRFDLPQDSPCLEYARDITAAARRAASLTQRLLAFSRRQHLAPRVVDLGPLLADQCQVLRRLLPEDIALRLNLEAAEHAVYADPSQLEQILLNLVVNARDAMREGGTIDVDLCAISTSERPVATSPLAPGAPAAGWLRLAVTDSGSGMPEHVRARVFEPFFTTKAEGAGIGLATVHGIVQQLGGHIEVTSEVQRGTRFEVYLPRSSRAIDAWDDGRGRPPVRGGARNILLVDDDPLARATLSLLLERHGFVVTVAASGEEALALARGASAHVDLLVSDLLMPGMSGKELAAQVRTLRPNLPVLLMSGHTADEQLRHGISAAFDAIIEKPFDIGRLLARIADALEQTP